MPYIYPGVDSLLKQPFIKDGDCVDLIKALVPGLIGKSTTSWKQGENLMEARRAGKTVPRGTAVATFENGRYPQKCSGNYNGTRQSCRHAALLLRVDPSGIWVMDQYKGDNNRLFIFHRLIRLPPPREQKFADGTWRDAGNNALAYYVIAQ